MKKGRLFQVGEAKRYQAQDTEDLGLRIGERSDQREIIENERGACRRTIVKAKQMDLRQAPLDQPPQILILALVEHRHQMIAGAAMNQDKTLQISVSISILYRHQNISQRSS